MQSRRCHPPASPAHSTGRSPCTTRAEVTSAFARPPRMSSRLSGDSTRGSRLGSGARCSLLLLALATSGCSSVFGVEAPRVRSHRITGAGPLVQMLRVELQRGAPVRVEYWTDDGRRLFVDSSTAATHSILLSRLRPDRTYLYRIVGTSAEGAFTTEALPPDL